MIQKCSIRNFKGVHELDLTDMKRITLLGGKNNVGKTSILEAIFMFHDRLNPSMMFRQYNWRGVNQIALTVDSLFAPLFYRFDLSQDINIGVEDKFGTCENMILSFETVATGPVQMKIEDGKVQTDRIYSSKKRLEVKYINKLSNSEEQKVYYDIDNGQLNFTIESASPMNRQVNFLSAKGNYDPNDSAVLYGQLDVNGMGSEIVSLLQIIEPNIKSISTVTLPNNLSMLYCDIGIGKKVPIPYVGDGMSRLLYILLVIMTNKGGLIIVDEIENGFHYSVLPKVWEVISTAIKQNDCQLIATTHSYECLQGAIKGIQKEFHDDFSFIRVEKEFNDKMIGNTFDFEMLETAISHDWEVR